MLDHDTLAAEIANLERVRARLAAALQQAEGALAFARGLLAKCAPPGPAGKAEGPGSPE